VICHGIPDMRELQDGDIVNIDVSTFHKGYHGDLNEVRVRGFRFLFFWVCMMCMCDGPFCSVTDTHTQTIPPPTHIHTSTSILTHT
jgi:hypothetical protein